ncbi:cohesin domain-containing protein [Clostridium cellulovorans]|uniref:Cellulosome anchoring protein cohesin region n=1 Tax=Clostridium cellulovorans (strain ATCC 35296 / DSM 3052 / OCM 3 / 743B) TaxID=573061 RepID=D9SN69_CLOC7|nr:cohesin domain-containing protein [Clostridium cellulovorans]ADL51935.1 cellulosome anchoring protein cohesin region [Clostridium cellulovorans 743B]
MKILFNKKIKKSFSTIFVLSFFMQMSLFGIPVLAAYSPAQISYVVTGEATVGNTIIITANISSVSNLYALSWDFIYDSNMLQIQSIESGSILGTSVQKNIINNLGQASIWISKTGNVESTNGSGTVAIIKAKVLKAGVIDLKTTNDKATLNLTGSTSCIKLSDNNGNMLMYNFTDTSITSKIVSPLSPGKYENTNSNLTYSGSWTKVSDGSQQYSNITNSVLTFTFEGAGLNIYALMASNRGIAKVYIDDVAYDFDEYNASAQSKIVFTKDGLKAGIHTAKVVVSGTKNPASSGYYISIHAIEILGAPTNLVAGKYENTDSKLNYTGSWTKVSDGSQHYSNVTNSVLTFTFEGSGLNIYALMASNRGVAKVYIDDVAYDVDEYNASTQSKIVFTKDGLATGKHTAKIVVSGTKNPASSGYYISIDAIEILSAPVNLIAGKYENTDPKLTYTGSWSKTSDGTQSYSNVTNSVLAFTFEGVGLNIYALKASNRGIAKVYIDDVAYDVDEYNASPQSKVVFTKAGLSVGKHTAKIVVSGTKNVDSSGYYISIDAIEILSAPTNLVAGKYENTDSRLVYSGSWTKSFDGSQHYSNVTNSVLNFTFEGSGLNIYALMASNRGMAKVYIDDVAYDVDEYNASSQNKVVFTKDGLSAGKHTAKIVVSGTKNADSSGYYISIDAIEILSAPTSLVAGKYENTDSRLIYSGAWTKSFDGSQHYSNITNSVLTFNFQGSGLNIYALMASNRGIAKVYIDDVAYDVDEYSALSQGKVILAKDGLTPGNHTAKIVVSGNKNIDSSGYYISIDAVEIK